MHLSRIATFLLILALVPAGSADAFSVPERRKPQFEKELGYYVFPMPYSLPGIGDGLAAVGAAMNVGGTYTDLLGFGLTGDMKGGGLVTKDVHLLPELLVLDVTFERFSKATLTSYGQRGMNTDKHDYSYLELGSVDFLASRFTATFLERRIELFGGAYAFSSSLERLLDNEGTEILVVTDPQVNRNRITTVGTRIDVTDDYADPRKGTRLEISRWYSPPRSDNNADYYFMEYNANAYFPLGRRNTLILNAFRSDAHVTRQGETDRTVVNVQEGLNCHTLLDPEQMSECWKVVDNIVEANTYGTVGSLGGTSRLRSYPHDRFTAAHALFYCAEFRWNLTEERQPFDIVIMKDIRTVWQAAFFYEAGTVADRRDELGDVWRSSYGVGLRMVTASGIVFRADVASGKEGVEASIIVGYPWEAL